MRHWPFTVVCCFTIAILLAVSVLPAVPAEPEPDLKKSWITFLSHRTGDNILYRMRPDGSELSPIFGGTVKSAPGFSDGLSQYREPHWTWQSPDRKHFVSCAYDRIRPIDRNGFRPQFALHLGRTDGTGPTRIIAPVCAEAAAWSPDGKRVAYTVVTNLEDVGRHSSRVSRVYVAAIDGTSEQIVFDRPGYWVPQDWSPDGKRLILQTSDHTKGPLSYEGILELDLVLVEQAVKVVPQRLWG